MRYVVLVGGRSFDIVVSGDCVEVDGIAVRTHLDSIPGTPLRRLTVGGRARTMALEWSGDDGWTVQCGGERWAVRAVDERTRRLEELTKGGAAPHAGGLVRAPMPGLVLRVDVDVGQKVEAGTGLVLLEAMKMENEIRAPGPGIVSAVHVEGNEAVEKGTVLVEIGSLDEESGHD